MNQFMNLLILVLYDVFLLMNFPFQMIDPIVNEGPSLLSLC